MPLPLPTFVVHWLFRVRGVERGNYSEPNTPDWFTFQTSFSASNNLRHPQALLVCMIDYDSTTTTTQKGLQGLC